MALSFTDVQGEVGDTSPFDACLTAGPPANPTDYFAGTPTQGSRHVAIELTRPLASGTLAFSLTPGSIDGASLLLQQQLADGLFGWVAFSGSFTISRLGADGFDFSIVDAHMKPGAGGLGSFTTSGCGTAPP